MEDFWGLYNHIELASRLASGCDYSLFKEGIKPMWEDERNRRGGRWLINLDKKQRNSCLDNFWLEVQQYGYTTLCLRINSKNYMASCGKDSILRTEIQ